MSGPPHSTTGAAAPFHVMAKPIGPMCNLDCRYCFYLEKTALFSPPRNFRMSDDVLERFVRSYIASHPEGTAEINFAWQGGEPTLMGIPFFERALAFQAQYARPGTRITNALQTNGTLLDDEWAEFLKRHDFLVGISIDGPEPVHDRHRIDKAGRGSFSRVMAGLEVLKRKSVEFNTLTVLHRDNADDPKATYDFLEGIGSTFFQFIPIVEHSGMLEAKLHQRPLGATSIIGKTLVGGRSVLPRQYGTFMNGIFDRWLERDDVGRIYVQQFDMLLGLVMGYPSSLCVHAENCGRGLAIEHTGDVYSCDHFVSPEFWLGNIVDSNLGHMAEGSFQGRFGRNKRDSLPRYCRECQWLRYCWGACPKDRVALTPHGDEGLAYLCEGYRMMYTHMLPTFQKMAECLRMGCEAREYRNLPRLRLRGHEAPASKTGRNDPCPCGSGRKYKKCCGAA